MGRPWAAFVVAVASVASAQPDAGAAGGPSFPGFKALELVRVIGGTRPAHLFLAKADSPGGFFVAGPFEDLEDVDAPTLARLESDGSLSPWRPPAPLLPSSMVRSSGTTESAELYVASNSPSADHRGLVVLDVRTGQRLPSSPFGFRQISQLAISGDRLLAVDSDGSQGAPDSIQLRSVDGSRGKTVLVSGGRVHSVLADPRGFFVGGDFTKIGTARRHGIAFVDLDGAVGPFNAGLEPGSDVYAIAATDSRVYLGGHLRVPPPRGQKRDVRDLLGFARSGQRLAPIANLDVHIIKELALWGRYLFAASFGGWDSTEIHKVKFLAIDTEQLTVLDALDTEGPSSAIAISGDRLLLGHRLFRLPPPQ